MKFQAIFFDIDGTLFSFKTHTIPASAKSAIHQLRNKGIKVIIATGRAFSEMSNLDDLEFDGYITANGSCCTDSQKNIIAQHPLSKESMEKLALYLDKKPFPCTFFTEKGRYINYIDEHVLLLNQLVNLPLPPVKLVTEIIEHDVIQLSAFINTEQEAEILSHVLTDCNGSRWHPSFADINAKRCNKATGMDIFLRFFNIESGDTMAFGDGGNDIPMLKHATIGVAMDNAADNVKEAADYVTDAVDENGIFKALKYFNII